MSFTISDFPKNSFKAFRDESSIYFGEIAYLATDNAISSNPIGNSIPIRHGVGVQLNFEKGTNTLVSKFEGYWEKNKKIKTGQFLFPNKDTYNGEIEFEKPNGFGKYKWDNKMTYDGNWRKGRIEGGGKFTHEDVFLLNQEHILEGMFKNNYFQFVKLFELEQ